MDAAPRMAASTSLQAIPCHATRRCRFGAPEGPSGAPIHVTVFDKNDIEVGKLVLPGIGQKQFVGLIMNGGKAIGRVNIWDEGGGPNQGAEGITQLEVFVPAPAALPCLEWRASSRVAVAAGRQEPTSS